MSNGYKNEFYTPEENTAVLRRRLRPENMAPAKPGHRQLSPFPRSPEPFEPPKYQPMPLAPIEKPKLEFPPDDPGEPHEIDYLPYDPDGKQHIKPIPYKPWPLAPDAEDISARLQNLMKDADTLRRSAENRYKDGYYDAYRGDAADYAAGFTDAQGKLNGTAAVLLGEIEAQRPVYGGDWADEAKRSVGSAMKKIAGYSDMVRSDPVYWSQYKDEADYGAAMFRSGAESGADLHNMVDAKNKTTGGRAAATVTQKTASPAPSQPRSGQAAPVQPAAAKTPTKSAPIPGATQKGTPTSTQNNNNAFADPGILEAQKAMAQQAPYLMLNGQTTTSTASSPLAYTTFGVPANQIGLDRLDQEIQMLTEYSNKLKEREYALPVTNGEATGTVTNSEREKLKVEIARIDAEIAEKKTAAVKLQKYIDTLKAQEAPKVDMNAIAMPFQQTASAQSVDDLKQVIRDLREEQSILWATLGNDPEKMSRYDMVTKMLRDKEKSLEQQQTDYFYKQQDENRYQLEKVMNDNSFASIYTSFDGTKISDTAGIKGVVKYLTDDVYRENVNKQLADQMGTDPFSNLKLVNKITENAALSYMTPEETHILEYYAAKNDWDSAQKYYGTIKRDLQARYQTAVSQWTADYSNEHKGMGVIMNIAGTLTSPVAFGATIWQNIKNTFSKNYEPVNTNTWAFSGAHMEQDSKEGITRDLYKTDKVLAEAGIALANYLVTAPLSAPAQAAISVSEAAGKTALAAAQSGATASQVFQVSTTAGVIDYLVSKIPFNKLPEISREGKGALLFYLEDVGKSAGIKDVKEIIKYYGNTISDQLIMDNKSKYNKAVDEYIAQGYSEEEAARKAFENLYITTPLNKLCDNTLTNFGKYGIDKSKLGIS